MQQDEKRKEALVREVNDLADKLCAKLGEMYGLQQGETWSGTFRRCFVNTVETTVQCLEDGSIFLITGDIEAMWLRDSSAQVSHYMPFLREYPELAAMVRDLIARQFFYITIDPYANAFNAEPNGRCWEHDDTESNDWEWERKYEIDSLCYPVRLLEEYYRETGDQGVFTEGVLAGLKKIVETFLVEQHHETSPYRFQRSNCPPTDTLECDGKGVPVGDTGMIWGGFRPSDDACRYGYHIPSNLFAAHILEKAERILREMYGDEGTARQAAQLRTDILDGIRRFGMVRHETFGEIYGYETDGYGNYCLMDDANVPSLLSLPWLHVCESRDPVYQNTRRFVLSQENPYYYSGKAAQGVGSPHTPKGYIWPIALSVQGLTSEDEEEQKKLLETLLHTDAGTGYMHEGFDCQDPTKFTREWFAWSNSLFALFVIRKFLHM